MNLNAYQLLQSSSHHYWQGRQSFSKEEIQKKINEIKYLSSQKKVPRITLRKEIIHLENKLQSIFDLEQAVLQQKKRESEKVLALKRQIQVLQQRLATAADKDLQKKVDRLTHLLGEYLAQKQVQKELYREHRTHPTPKVRKRSVARLVLGETEVVSEEMKSRVRNLQERLQLLKQALEISRGLGKVKEVQSLQLKIDVVEEKVQQYLQRHPELMVELPEPYIPEVGVEAKTEEEQLEQIKHTILFGLPASGASGPPALGQLLGGGEKAGGAGEEGAKQEEDLELEKELPLPPPPKRRM